MSEDSPTNTILIGLSGPTSSGKTTLARLLRGIFNINASPSTNNTSIKLFILHEDDFYKSDKDIPERTVSSPEHGTRTIQDWDCIESLNLPQLDTAVRHIKLHGSLPPDLLSKEDQNTVGEVGVSDAEISSHHASVTSWLGSLPNPDSDSAPRHISICILDGFLLFPPPPGYLAGPGGGVFSEETKTLFGQLYDTMREVLGVSVFLPSTRERTVQRRAARTGYVTMEGFWADPPGFVEDVVWPNYRRDHAWLFRGRKEVDMGMVDRESEWVVGEGLVVGPGRGEVKMREMLAWGVEVVKGKLEDAFRGDEK